MIWSSSLPAFDQSVHVNRRLGCKCAGFDAIDLSMSGEVTTKGLQDVDVHFTFSET